MLQGAKKRLDTKQFGDLKFGSLSRVMLGASAAPPAVEVGWASGGVCHLSPSTTSSTAAAVWGLPFASHVAPPFLSRPGRVSGLVALVLRRSLHRPKDGLGHAGELGDEAGLVSRRHWPGFARGRDVLLQDLQVNLCGLERTKWDAYNMLWTQRVLEK